MLVVLLRRPSCKNAQKSECDVRCAHTEFTLSFHDPLSKATELLLFLCFGSLVYYVVVAHHQDSRIKKLSIIPLISSDQQTYRTMNYFALTLSLCVLALLSALTHAEEVAAASKVIMFNKDTSKADIFDNPIKKQALFFTDETESHHDPTMRMFESMAEEFEGQLLVIRIPFSETDYVKHFHVQHSALPALFAIDMTDGMKKIPYGGDVQDVELTHGFVSAFAHKKLVESTEL
jgi:hypothetical protein